jgi:hypothetical protein
MRSGERKGCQVISDDKDKDKDKYKDKEKDKDKCDHGGQGGPLHLQNH